MTRERIRLPGSRSGVSCPWTAAGSSLYIHRLTSSGLQNPEAGSYMCPARFLPFPILQHKLHISWRFMSMGPNPPLGSGPLSLRSKTPYSLSSWASIWIITCEHNPAPPGRFILGSYIPNSYPSHGLVPTRRVSWGGASSGCRFLGCPLDVNFCEFVIDLVFVDLYSLMLITLTCN